MSWVDGNSKSLKAEAGKREGFIATTLFSALEMLLHSVIDVWYNKSCRIVSSVSSGFFKKWTFDPDHRSAVLIPSLASRGCNPFLVLYGVFQRLCRKIVEKGSGHFALVLALAQQSLGFRSDALAILLQFAFLHTFCNSGRIWGFFLLIFYPNL